MQFSNACLLSSDGSDHLNELIDEPQQFRIIAHPTSKSLENLLCLELNN